MAIEEREQFTAKCTTVGANCVITTRTDGEQICTYSLNNWGGIAVRDDCNTCSRIVDVTKKAPWWNLFAYDQITPRKQ